MRSLLRHLWVPPLAFALLVIVAGTWTYYVINARLRSALAADLTTIRDSAAAGVTEWMLSQERAATVAAREGAVREAAFKLIERARGGASVAELETSPEQQQLRALLADVVEQWGFESFAVVVDKTVVATSRPADVGAHVTDLPKELVFRLNSGETVLSRPMLPFVGAGPSKPFMWVAAPLREDEDGVPQGLLAFRIDPEESFTRILRIARFGGTGETYAFGPDGLLVSYTRLIEQLRDLDLLGKTESAILKVHIRDPGTDLTRGGEPLGPIEKRPLTHMAASATQGGRGVDIDGYSDFRGVKVVGAWVWLPRYQFGLVTEMDKREAYQTLSVVRNAVSGLVAILGLAAAAIAFGSRLLARLSKSTARLERLGQYTLEETIGEGGMGTVYRARHAFLKRPTALKVIRSEHISDADRRRFEREVQATSQLTHPNVVAIYDYGRTSAGVFYYAMEYLEGISLADLVRDDGAQPQGRVLFILRQMCGALADAHAAGLVHRDVKPANAMLCARGGLFDVVKVVDFGLVKSVERLDDSSSDSNAISGTPHYMAPEVIKNPEHVDTRSDVYAVAAVGFYLLTGRELFEADNVLAVLTLHVTTDAPRPSSISAEPIHPALDALLLECLDRDPMKRPSDAGALLAQLDALAGEPELTWTQDAARKWWAVHGSLLHRVHEPVLTTPTLCIDWEHRGNGALPISGREPTLLAPSRPEHGAR